MKRITKVTIRTEFDESPDLSYLGEITKTRQYDIQRHRLSIPTNPNDMDNTEWYMPENHLPHNEENWKRVSLIEKEQTIREYGSLRKADIHYAYEDLKRLQDYYNQQWWCEGITVTAKIEVSENGKNWAHDEVIASLWGIESDDTKKHKQDIIEDLKSEISHDLKIWGFTEDAIAAAMASATEENIWK
jgi:hypothetical protein